MPAFLNSTFLMIGAAAVAVPIVIHLLMRNKVVRIDFAAMRFLMESKKQVVRWLRIKQLLVLLMRIAAVALLAMAFARPFLPTSAGLALWSDDEKEVGLIVDVSASMMAGNNADAAKGKLRQFFDSLPPETIVSVYFSGGTSQLVVEKEPYSEGIAARVLSAFQPTHRQGNLREAIQFMDDVLRGSALFKRELTIVSDFQKSSWPETGGFLQMASRAKVNLLPVVERSWNNVAIIDAQIPEESEQPWLCTVYNYSTEALKSADVRLVIAGKTIATQKAEFADGATQVVQFDKVTLQNGNVSGYFEVEFEGDAFPVDNRYYFVTSHRQFVRVLAVNGEKASGASDELFFADKAINTRGSAFRLIETDATKFAQLSPEAFEIVLLANVTGLNNASMQKLKTFVQNGGGLLIAPGDKVDTGFYNRFFEDIAPASLQTLARQDLDRSGGEILLISNLSHPAFSRLGSSLGGDLSTARFYQFWRLQPQPSSQTLATFGDNSPAIVTTAAGRGKVVMLSFPLDAEWSDLPIQTSYLPLLHTLLAAIQPPIEKVQFARVGQPLYLGDTFQPSRQIAITTPDGVESTWQAENLIYNSTSLPGIYRFQQQALTKNIAVNMAADESETELFVPEAFLAKLSSGDELTAIDPSKNALTIPQQEAEADQKMWRLLLFAAFAFIVGESLLGNRTPR